MEMNITSYRFFAVRLDQAGHDNHLYSTYYGKPALYHNQFSHSKSI